MLAEGPVFAVHQSDAVLAAMDDWNRKQHGGSGLIERVRASRIDAATAERETLTFLEAWAEPGRSPMCGNSICQDRRFLARHMPALERFFHYRNLDVSTLKELAQRWAPQIAQAVPEELDAPRARRCARVDPRAQVLPRAVSASLSRPEAPPSAALSSARNIQVSTTVSGFSDRLSMPCSTSQRASSGWSEGP